MLWLQSTGRYDQEVRRIAAFLSQIRSPHLREISFYITTITESYLLMAHLRHLEIRWLDSFAMPVLDPFTSVQEETHVRRLTQGLRSVKVDLRFACRLHSHELDRVRAHVEAQLPALTERGILQLVVGEWQH